MGMDTSKQLPIPSVLETDIFPPSKLTIPLTMERPSPNPSADICGAAFSKGLNTRLIVS